MVSFFSDNQSQTGKTLSFSTEERGGLTGHLKMQHILELELVTVAFVLWKISINQDKKLINLNFMPIYNVIIIFESFPDD